MFAARRSFLFKKNTPVYKIDTKELVSNLDLIKSSAYRFFVYSPSCDIFKKDVSKRTIKQALNKGHTDLNIWVCVNQFKKDIIIHNGYRREIHKPAETSFNWVIDLDRGCKCHSIADVLSLFNKAKIGLPYIITQTGPENFHIVMLSNAQHHFNSKLFHVTKLFGIEGISTKDGNSELFTALRENGVDIGYLRQSDNWAKIRVGGSVNTKHIKDDKPFICKMWINKDAGETTAIQNQEDPIVEKKDIRVDISKRIPTITKLLRPVLGAKSAKSWGHYFASNFKFLKEGQLYISQTKFSSKYNIAQTTVSRQIKKMKSAGLLHVTDSNYEYRKGKQRRAKVYRATNTMVDYVSKVRVITKKIINNEYTAGESNRKMLYDIKTMTYSGFSDESIKKICEIKMLSRPKKNRKTIGQIINAIKNARIRFGIPFSGQENPCADTIIRRIEVLYDKNTG